jgi:ADP-L-glycero-D-manno-heptose 6-epimerase
VIVVTGGAGFIGSALVWGLNRRGREDVLVVDRLGRGEKWRNLAGLRFLDICEKQAFLAGLEGAAYGGQIEAVLHMGACSSTTERDADYLMENNYRYSVRLARWCAAKGARLVYASSAATYGDGSAGYGDAESRLFELRPLNAYGLSKHLFDLHALREGWLETCVGLKFFNVFGPNEAHKGDMRSVLAKSFPDVCDSGRLRLFKSHRPEFGDGEQRRDFVYVKDVVEATLFFLERPRLAGLYNVGSGRSRSWNELASALFAAVGREPYIEYVPMPEAIRKSYQYVTQADVERLRAAGFRWEFTGLEDAVREYVRDYLAPDERLGDARPGAAGR